MTVEQPAINLTRYAFKRDRGDLTLYGTWVFNDDKEDTEPCLVVMPRYRTGRPCVVALSAAYKYVLDPRYLAHRSRDFAIQLGFTDDMTNARKVGELIHDHMLDLLQMPNDPTEAVQVGEATVTDGREKRGAAIFDHVQIQ